MAYGSYANALTAIREALDDGHGNLRTIATTRFDDTFFEGTNEAELARRGISAAKPFQVRIVSRSKNPASPHINSSVILRDVVFEVTVSRTVGVLEKISSDDMATLSAVAAEDADAIEQVLTTPPNLNTTVAGASTGLCGGVLLVEGPADFVLIPGTSDGAGRMEIRQKFKGVMQVAPATS